MQQVTAHYTDLVQGTTSTFGAFLDPVADKLMVAAVLVLVASRPLAVGPFAGNAWLTPALAIGAALFLLERSVPCLHALAAYVSSASACAWLADAVCSVLHGSAALLEAFPARQALKEDSVLSSSALATVHSTAE